MPYNQSYENFLKDGQLPDVADEKAYFIDIANEIIRVQRTYAFNSSIMVYSTRKAAHDDLKTYLRLGTENIDLETLLAKMRRALDKTCDLTSKGFKCIDNKLNDLSQEAYARIRRLYDVLDPDAEVALKRMVSEIHTQILAPKSPLQSALKVIFGIETDEKVVLAHLFYAAMTTGEFAWPKTISERTLTPLRTDLTIIPRFDIGAHQSMCPVWGESYPVVLAARFGEAAVFNRFFAILETRRERPDASLKEVDELYKKMFIEINKHLLLVNTDLPMIDQIRIILSTFLTSDVVFIKVPGHPHSLGSQNEAVNPNLLIFQLIKYYEYSIAVLVVRLGLNLENGKHFDFVLRLVAAGLMHSVSTLDYSNNDYAGIRYTAMVLAKHFHEGRTDRLTLLRLTSTLLRQYTSYNKGWLRLEGEWCMLLGFHSELYAAITDEGDAFLLLRNHKAVGESSESKPLVERSSLIGHLSDRSLMVAFSAKDYSQIARELQKAGFVNYNQIVMINNRPMTMLDFLLEKPTEENQQESWRVVLCLFLRKIYLSGRFESSQQTKIEGWIDALIDDNEMLLIAEVSARIPLSITSMHKLVDFALKSKRLDIADNIAVRGAVFSDENEKTWYQYIHRKVLSLAGQKILDDEKYPEFNAEWIAQMIEKLSLRRITYKSESHWGRICILLCEKVSKQACVDNNPLVLRKMLNQPYFYPGRYEFILVVIRSLIVRVLYENNVENEKSLAHVLHGYLSLDDVRENPPLEMIIKLFKSNKFVRSVESLDIYLPVLVSIVDCMPDVERLNVFNSDEFKNIKFSDFLNCISDFTVWHGRFFAYYFYSKSYQTLFPDSTEVSYERIQNFRLRSELWKALSNPSYCLFDLAAALIDDSKLTYVKNSLYDKLIFEDELRDLLIRSVIRMLRSPHASEHVVIARNSEHPPHVFKMPAFFKLYSDPNRVDIMGFIAAVIKRLPDTVEIPGLSEAIKSLKEDVVSMTLSKKLYDRFISAYDASIAARSMVFIDAILKSDVMLCRPFLGGNRVTFYKLDFILSKLDRQHISIHISNPFNFDRDMDLDDFYVYCYFMGYYDKEKLNIFSPSLRLFHERLWTLVRSFRSNWDYTDGQLNVMIEELAIHIWYRYLEVPLHLRFRALKYIIEHPMPDMDFDQKLLAHAIFSVLDELLIAQKFREHLQVHLQDKFGLFVPIIYNPFGFFDEHGAIDFASSDRPRLPVAMALLMADPQVATDLGLVVNNPLGLIIHLGANRPNNPDWWKAFHFILRHPQLPIFINAGRRFRPYDEAVLSLSARVFDAVRAAGGTHARQEVGIANDDLLNHFLSTLIKKNIFSCPSNVQDIRIILADLLKHYRYQRKLMKTIGHLLIQSRSILTVIHQLGLNPTDPQHYHFLLEMIASALFLMIDTSLYSPKDSPVCRWIENGNLDLSDDDKVEFKRFMERLIKSEHTADVAQMWVTIASELNEIRVFPVGTIGTTSPDASILETAIATRDYCQIAALLGAQDFVNQNQVVVVNGRSMTLLSFMAQVPEDEAQRTAWRLAFETFIKKIYFHLNLDPSDGDVLIPVIIHAHTSKDQGLLDMLKDRGLALVVSDASIPMLSLMPRMYHAPIQAEQVNFNYICEYFEKAGTRYVSPPSYYFAFRPTGGCERTLFYLHEDYCGTVPPPTAAGPRSPRRPSGSSQ